MAAHKSYLETDKLKERFLQCGVCMETFNEEERYPLLLPCLHSFCCKCLASLPKDGTLECPLCKAKHPVNGDSINSVFPKDNTRRDLLDFVRVTAKETRIPCGLCDENETATHRCQECECFICENCKQMHEKMKTFQHHLPVSLSAISDGPIDQLQYFRRDSCCKVPDHENEQLKMYCSSPCEATICTLCAVMSHKDHTISNIGEVYQKESESIQCLSDEVQNKISETETIIADVDAEIVKFPVCANKEKMELKAAIANAISMLQRREEELCKEIDMHESTKGKILEAQKDHLQRYVDSCVEAIQFLEQSLAHKNKPAFLEISKTIRSRLEELKSTHHDKIPHARVSSLKFQPIGLKAMEFQNLTNKLGKVLCTNTYIPNSEFHHAGEKEVGKELQFEIKIQNENGMKIKSEVVEIRIGKPPGHDQLLRCEYVDAEEAYRTVWNPKDSGIFTLTFMSNGIDLEVESLKTIKIGNAQLPPHTKLQKQVSNSSRGKKNLGQSVKVTEALKDGECPICKDFFKNPWKLPCGHCFCKTCIDQHTKKKESCPSCFQVFGKIRGDQPKGSIEIIRHESALPGYEDVGHIEVKYTIQEGVQGKNHPNPGQSIGGRKQRSGFLPDNDDGRLIAMLLNIAFSRRLIFTVDKSQTTGEEGAVVWNDIHHKTRIDGGEEQYGYPDPTYLTRVFAELKDKGVTLESADDPKEYTEYTKTFKINPTSDKTSIFSKSTLLEKLKKGTSTTVALVQEASRCVSKKTDKDA